MNFSRKFLDNRQLLFKNINQFKDFLFMNKMIILEKLINPYNLIK